MTADHAPRIVTPGRVKAALRNPHKALTKLPMITTQAIRRLRSQSFESYYLDATKQDVDVNPAGAVGPDELYDKMGEWQFDLLRENGLRPEHRLLDIGCGVLRGGQHFIEYLEPTNYYGMDIAPECIKQCRSVLRERGLVERQPTLILNTDLRFGDPEFVDTTFDFILAQSVFTHLPPAGVRECFDHLDRVLGPDGRMFATYYPAETPTRTIGGTGVRYPLSFFEECASGAGFDVRAVAADHPNDLSTFEVTYSD